MWVIIEYIILGIFWGLLSWLGWKAWTAFRVRRAGRVAVYSVLTALMLWAGLEIGIVPGAGVYHGLSMTNKLFGTRFLLGEPSFNYDTERNLTGDGFSLTVYPLSEAQVKHLMEGGQELFTHPSGFSHRSKWQLVPWQRAPMREEVAKYLDFCRGWDGGNEPKAREIIDQVEVALAGTGCLYSYCYQEHKWEENIHLSDVDFFFVDFKRRLLVLINQQT